MNIIDLYRRKFCDGHNILVLELKSCKYFPSIVALNLEKISHQKICMKCSEFLAVLFSKLI